LRHTYEAAVVNFAALGKDGRLVTAAGTPGDPAARWARELRPDGRPVQELVRLAEVLAGRRAEDGAGLVPLDAGKLGAVWRDLRSRHANDFTPSADRARAWERRGADECEGRKLWAGAVRHLDRLLGGVSASGDLYARRARAHGELRQWERALADYTKALDGGSRRPDLWAGRGEAAARLGRWDQAAADYAKAVELRGHDAELWVRKAGAEAERGKWDRATADLAKAVRLGRNDADVVCQQAVALLAGGDQGGYRRVCARLVQRFGASEDDTVGRAVARVCTLGADAVPDLKPLLRQAERAVTADPRSAADLRRLAVLLYRAGRFDAALKRVQAELALRGPDRDPCDRLLLAMLQHRLGHGAEARKALDEAGREKPKEVTWQRRAEYEVLRREAEGLLKGAKP
jgi:tetratricopeptide (TPR) repeat protein